MGSPAEYRLITNTGLEDIVAAEARSLLGSAAIQSWSPRPLSAGGHVRLSIDTTPDTERLLSDLLTAYHVLRDRGALTLEAISPESIAERIDPVDFPELAGAISFRVTCARIGNHDFTHPQVERAVGGRLQEAYGTRVDLTTPAVVIRLDVVDNVVLVGIQLSRESLARRYRWAYKPRVTLQPPVAAALIKMATFRWDATATRCPLLLDPFCGSGTIVLEAVHAFDRVRALGSDWDDEAVAGARENAVNAGCEAPCAFFRADARDLQALAAESVDLVVTNPPFGVRLGSNIAFRPFYRAVLSEASRVLRPGGRMCLLVGKRRIDFTRALGDEKRLVRKHVRVINTGGVFPAAFVLEKR